MTTQSRSKTLLVLVIVIALNILLWTAATIVEVFTGQKYTPPAQQKNVSEAPELILAGENTRTNIKPLPSEEVPLKTQIRASRGGGPKELLMIATAYSPYDDQNGLNSDGDPYHTATGTRPRQGTVAVNPDIIPYGSKLIIIGNDFVEEGVAEDTGAAMRKDPYRIDLFRWTYEEAMEFGVKPVRVVILGR